MVCELYIVGIFSYNIYSVAEAVKSKPRSILFAANIITNSCRVRSVTTSHPDIKVSRHVEKLLLGFIQWEWNVESNKEDFPHLFIIV